MTVLPSFIINNKIHFILVLVKTTDGLKVYTMNLNLKRSLAGVLVAVSFLPVLAFAEDSGSATPAKTKSAANFCTNLSTREAKITDQIAATEAKISNNQSDRANKLATNQSKTDAKRAQGRTDADSKRLSNWNTMAKKAKTDAQKTAVEAYKTAIQQAVTTRRADIDIAVKTFRDGLTTTMTKHKAALDTAIVTFKTSLSAAVTKAQADCTAGIAPKTVSTTFNQSIKDARKVLQDARKSADMSSGLTALRKTRDDAIKAIEQTFKIATEKARADLTLAFK